MSISGSSVVTDSRDFNNGIYLNDGSTVVFGRQMLRHAGTMSLVIRSVIKACEKDPGIVDGDMFIVNNPYQGAIHHPDVSIVAPYFHDKECLVWFGACAHQLDVGGMEAGSLCPRATESFQEGINIPPVKLVKREKLRKDLFNMILSNSRLPSLLGLDLHALIASNEVAKKRFSLIVEKYGAETVKKVIGESLDLSERKLRQRLMELPDGIYRAVDYINEPFENKLYKVALSLEKEKDSLVFDFSGCSPQAPYSINCTESVTIGGVLSIVLTSLAYDIPWNQGIMRPLDIKIPDGTICNAKSPAAVSIGVASTGQCVNNVALAALNKLLGCSEKYRLESGGVGGGFFIMTNLSGKNQYGEQFGTSLLDTAAGSGAYSGKDGYGLGSRGVPIPTLPNIETNENIAPIVYLFRRYRKDGGGAGSFRGALPLGLAFIPHDTSELKFVTVSHGVKVPSALGLFGGYPGACNVSMLIKSTDITDMQKRGMLPLDTGGIEGERIDVTKLTEKKPLYPGDILENSRQGGGGCGSPFQRNQEMVLKDVVDGTVSVECARQLYGVVIEPRTAKIDYKKTENLRKENLLKVTSGKRPEMIRMQKKGVVKEIFRIGLHLRAVEIQGEKLIMCQCGNQFGPASDSWKNGAVRIIAPAGAAGPLVKLHADLEIRQYHCPDCGLLHSIDVSEKDSPDFWDLQLRFSH